jgi:hypothetical protein
MVSGVRRHRERQPMTIDYRHNHDLHDFPAPSRPGLHATAFRRGQGCVDITRRIVDRAYVAQPPGRSALRELRRSRTITKSGGAPSCCSDTTPEAVPLPVGVQNPPHRFVHFARSNRIAARTIAGIVLLPKIFWDQPPLFVRHT